MVEETTNNVNNKPKKTNKPKSVYEWNVRDVQNWLRRHCSDYHPLYADNFVQHDITGRALIRMNDNSLVRLGITDAVHREAIWREILKLRLKTDIIEIRDLQLRTNSFNFDTEYVKKLFNVKGLSQRTHFLSSMHQLFSQINNA